MAELVPCGDLRKPNQVSCWAAHERTGDVSRLVPMLVMHKRSAVDPELLDSFLIPEAIQVNKKKIQSLGDKQVPEFEVRLFGFFCLCLSHHSLA